MPGAATAAAATAAASGVATATAAAAAPPPSPTTAAAASAAAAATAAAALAVAATAAAKPCSIQKSYAMGMANTYYNYMCSLFGNCDSELTYTAIAPGNYSEEFKAYAEFLNWSL